MKKLIAAAICGLVSTVSLAADKPNVLAIMVDDVAPISLSAYSHGMTYPTQPLILIALLTKVHCLQTIMHNLVVQQGVLRF